MSARSLRALVTTIYDYFSPLPEAVELMIATILALSVVQVVQAWQGRHRPPTREGPAA